MSMYQDANHETLQTLKIEVTNSTQFREALARLRYLERSPSGTALGRERVALELAVSRYLACRESELGSHAPSAP